MNKKFLGILIVLTAIALITPVLANTAKKVLVDVDYGTAPSGVPVDSWLTGDVQHGSLTIPYTGFSIIGDGVDLQGGTATQTVEYSVNVKGVPTGLRMGKGVLHTKLEITFNEGQFVGNIKTQGIFRVFPNQKLGLYDGELHGVLHGTGECLGWTLFISGEANGGAYVHEEYMLIP